MSEQMRSEFEAWAKTRSLSLVKYDGGMYVSDETMWAEIAWVESRAALCVELPAKLYGYSGQSQEDRLIDADRNFVIDQCAKAIHAAGVKTR